MAESSTTAQSCNFSNGKGENYLKVPEKIDKGVRPQESCNEQSDGPETASSVSTKPPRRKKSLLESLRKSFSEFRNGPKSEGSKNDQNSQLERCYNKEPDVGEAEIEGTSVLGRCNERNKVDSRLSLPDTVKKLLSSQASSPGIKRGHDHICDVNKFRNEEDKTGHGLFDIVRHSNLQAVSLQRKLEEDWGLKLGRRDSGDLPRSPSMRRQHETKNQENTGLNNNINNCPDDGGVLRLKYSTTASETPRNGSSSEKPNPSLRSPHPRHGVYIIGLTEGGVAERCGELTVEDLIIEVSCNEANS